MRKPFSLLLIAIAIGHAFALTVRAQATDTNASTPSGVISGRVTSSTGDLPNNVVVYASASGVTQVLPRSTVVNNDGSFRIDGLEVGVYRVWTAAPGFVADAPLGTDARVFVHTGETTNFRVRKGGVLTGTVLNSNNAPVVGASVRAFRVRDEAGKAVELSTYFNERFTDDRGIYRIYGLAPGIYVVAAGGGSRFFGGFATTGYDQDVPTYAPSSTRDTAIEISIRSGEEATADIQYRGEPGHAISGKVNGVVQAATGIMSSATITVADVKSHTVVMTSSASSFTEYGFAIYGVPDGEYELVAQNFSSQTRDTQASEAKRIKVQGADVTGVNLTVAPLPTISGRVTLDSFTADCVAPRDTALQQTIIFGRREKQTAKSTESKTNPTADEVPLLFASQIAEAVAAAKGDFVLRNLHAGTYRLSVTLPSARWYLKSITLGASPRSADSRIISDGITLNTQSVSGINVTISEGAALVRGTVVTDEGKPVRDRMIIYFVPAEKEAASNLLRYFETRSEADGSFELRNVSPGEYLVMALHSDENRQPGILIRLDSGLRANIVRDAQKLDRRLALKPCERIDNFELPNQLSSKP